MDMMNYNEQKTVIDLSDALNISGLSIKISSILDSSGVQNKELFLKLGSLDLKRSQLLSIKALVEAMQSRLVGIETTSEMTEKNLDLNKSSPGENENDNVWFYGMEDQCYLCVLGGNCKTAEVE